MFDINGLMNGDLSKKVEDYVKKAVGASDVKHPFSTCPALCQIAPEGCDQCSALENKVIQALSFIENEDEYYAQFEICDTVEETERICSICGAPVGMGETECEYCGAKLSAEKARIKVKSKQDIPNPVMSAYEAVRARKQYVADQRKKNSSEAGGGLLKSVVGSMVKLTNQINAVEKAMTLSEIESTAKAYNVTVRSYLEGMDNGKYLTATGKAAVDWMRQQTEASAARTAAAQANRPAANNGMMDFMQRHAQYSGGTGYMGKSSSSCCGNCRYYLMGSNECGNNHYKHPSGASDYCGAYRSM